MPLYTYKCKACGKGFEKLVRIGAEAPACPACGSRETVRDFAALKPFGCPGSGSAGCSGSCEHCSGCHH